VPTISQEAELLSRIWIPILLVLFIVIGLSAGMPDGSVVPASMVEAKIWAGEQEKFDYCTIVGSLNLDGLNIERQVHFNHTVFRDSVTFNSTTFKGSANFRGSEFNGTAYFEDSEFDDYADFGDSKFDGYADFVHSKFDGDTDFGYSKFNGTANFRSSEFDGDSDFGHSKFNGDAGFSSSEFDRDANFGYSKFDRDASFWNSAFNGYANFGDSKFNGYANFVHSKFDGDANFEDSKFNGDADFSRFRSSKNTSFIDSRFYGFTSFNNASFNKGLLQVGEEAVFSGTLDLNQSNIINIETYIRWNNIGYLAYNIRTYKVLFDNYKQWRLFEDYNNCYYAFRKELLFREAMSFTKLIDYFQWILNGFGMKPIFPIIWSIGIILISGSIFYITNGIRRTNEKNAINVIYIPGYKIPNKPFKERISRIIFQKRTISIGESILFSATYFSSGANNIISTAPIDLSPIGVSKYIAVLERLLGWFFFAQFLAALANTTIR